MGGWVVKKKTKLMLYSTLVEIEVGVELGNIEVFEILQYWSIWILKYQNIKILRYQYQHIEML